MFVFVVTTFLSCGNENKPDAEGAKALVEHFFPEGVESENIFVVSSYQCAGCVDSLLSIMRSDHFQSIMVSAVWVSPYEMPEYINPTRPASWMVVDQSEIEKFFPYAANVTYIRYESGEISECLEIGAKMPDQTKLRKLMGL